MKEIKVLLLGMIYRRLGEPLVIGIKLPEEHDTNEDPKGDDQHARAGHFPI